MKYYWLGCLILLIGFAIAVPDDREYVSGKQTLYQGSANLTAEQVAYLVGNHHVATLDVWILKDGGYLVDYDFFAEPGLDYLTPKSFSIWNIPVVHFIIGGLKEAWPIAVGGLVIMFLVFFTTAKPQRSRKYTTAIYTFCWRLFHIEYELAKHREPGLFKPKITEVVNVDPTESGVFAFRSWHYNHKSGYLKSTSRGYEWKSSVQVTTDIPDTDNSNGFHSYRLGSLKHNFLNGDFIGIVSLAGDFTEHRDGVMRAERVKILALIINKRFGESKYRRFPEYLSSVYGVPVHLADSPLHSCQQWLLSPNGIACLIHNAEILKGGLVEDGYERAGNTQGENTLREASEGTSVAAKN